MKSAFVFFALALREMNRSRVPHSAAAFVVALLVASLFAGNLSFESAPDVTLDFALTGSALFSAAIAIVLGLEQSGGASAPRFQPFLAAGSSRTALLSGRLAAAYLAAVIFAMAPPLCLSLAFSSFSDSATMLPDLRAACLLLPMESVLLVSVASFLAQSIARPMALALTFAIWIACHLHPDPLTFEILYPGVSGRILQFAGGLMPDLEMYNPRIHDAGSPSTIAAAILQCALYSLPSLAAAILVFRRKDLP
ncbi:MAG: hypothetical protein AAB229_00245 [Candidatus Hydrogenedentota bacterium]